MDYLELVDSTGRTVRDDKRGATSAHALDELKECAQMTGRKWITGQSLEGW
jgi:hypothetical protein